ncbi:MAG: hypothetical protein ACXAAN_16880 [Candidatus Thorarchaeota archaeon]
MSLSRIQMKYFGWCPGISSAVKFDDTGRKKSSMSMKIFLLTSTYILLIVASSYVNQIRTLATPCGADSCVPVCCDDVPPQCQGKTKSCSHNCEMNDCDCPPICNLWDSAGICKGLEDDCS